MSEISIVPQLRGEFFPSRNAYIAGEEPGIFHCHHYNCYLQAVLLDTESYLSGVKEILTDSAQEIGYTQFVKTFQQSPEFSIADRKVVVEDYFRFAGFGMITLDNVNDKGGVVVTDSEHYGVGWKSKFGQSELPVAYFTLGFISGALEAVYDLANGTLTGVQEKCIAKGDQQSQFRIEVGSTQKTLKPSVGEGRYQSFELNQPTDSEVNYAAIRAALTGMPIEGDASSGLINAFGVLLTRHYANYYSSISYRFLDLFLSTMGEDGKSIAIDLLTEAGHVCAFNTFGGIMQSNEWNGLIKPMFKTKEDWVHGIIAVINALGWGFWELVELVPNEKIVVKIVSGYESNAFLGEYDHSEYPISFLATGGVAGLMNLIYVLNLPDEAPITLDEDVYKNISNDSEYFTCKQIKCRAMGDDYDLFEATKD